MIKTKGIILILILGSFQGYAQKRAGCILGDCKVGIGALVFPDGRKYGGQFLNGKMNGQGTMTWPDKRKYEGSWKDDRFFGIGMMTWPDGHTYSGEWKYGLKDGNGTEMWSNKKSYVGAFKAGRRNGQGTMNFPDGKRYIGEWLNDTQTGQGLETLPNGEKYIGGWKNDLRDGQGTQDYANGSRYDGEWQENLKHGTGTFTTSDGEKYVGEWDKDMRSGRGVQTWKNNEKYVGDWVNNLREGRGTQDYADGSRYEGQWKNDKQNGQGVATYPDGSKYEGEWKDNKKNGQGTMTFATGVKHTGIWKDDVFDESQKPVVAANTVASSKPANAADLKVTGVTFSDTSGNENKVLDANEKAEIKFTLTNQGKGDATNLIIEVQDLNFTQGITYTRKLTFPALAAGAQKDIIIPVASSIELATGEVNFRIQVHEGNGYDASPFYIAFKTREFIRPRSAINYDRSSVGCIIGDCKDGKGTMVFPDGRKYTGQWKHGNINGRGTMLWPDGRQYEGQWKNDKQEGEGTEIGGDLSRYTGEWSNGVKSGKGTFISAIGRKYIGEWKNDKQEGQGLLTWPSGQKYLGKFQDGERNGKGQMIWPTGEKYDGEWKDDMQNGQGTFYYSDKQVYQGEWKDNQINGIGTMTYPGGEKKSGFWKDGAFIGDKADTQASAAAPVKEQVKTTPQKVEKSPVTTPPVVLASNTNTIPEKDSAPPAIKQKKDPPHTNTDTAVMQKKDPPPVSGASVKKNSPAVSTLLPVTVKKEANNTSKEKTDNKAQKIVRSGDPPILEVLNATFDDSSGNSDNILEVNEKGEIRFNLYNQGKGAAYNLVVQINDSNATKGLEYIAKYSVGNLAAGSNMSINIAVKGGAELDTGGTNFSIVVTDDRGDSTDPIYLNFRTQGKNPPENN